MLKQASESPNITTTTPKEHTDVRFISEILTADAFITKNNIDNIVKQITFNSEKPQKSSFLISRGNKNKDATVDVNITQEKAFRFDLDIKIGNNGLNDIFTGALCPFPLQENYKPISVLNNYNGIDLDFIQQQRIRHFYAIMP